MQAFDELNGVDAPYKSLSRVVCEVHEDLLVYGYVPRGEWFNCLIYVKTYVNRYAVSNKLKDHAIFSVAEGEYIFNDYLPESIRFYHQHFKGHGKFPYTFDRRYEAVESFDIFKDKQVVLNPEFQYKLAPYLKYTFGVEFETSMGYVPEDLCFRDGIIPLRDGSITGLEYSSVILEGNKGIALLHQEIETLKKYTSFNKDCSLHIHLGNYPLDPQKIYDVYLLCYYLQYELSKYVPMFTFNSSQYKDNGKDYCKLLPNFTSFESLYKKFVGRTFYGSLTQPHPNDLDRHHKWNLAYRYYFFNVMNMLCYNVNKTLEFRLLRPTYNFQKILVWLAIFNAILQYAEKVEISKIEFIPKLKDIVIASYPKEIAEIVCSNIDKLELLRNLQTNNKDNIGHDIWFEDELFNDDLI